MDVAKLLSESRYIGAGKFEEPEREEVRSPYTKDRDKIIYCSAFRRLQNKTQVHTMPGSDYVRTRLTHSLEVSCVGRTLGTTAASILNRGTRCQNAAEWGHVVEAACLAHDIGNPPFGHAGERAIQHWFGTSSGNELLEGLGDTERAEFVHYDGNAHGFRILTKTQAWRDEGGLRLTAATLGAFQKYPRLAKPGLKKFGVFQDDSDAFDAACEEMALVAGARHPLAILTEAADDICNTVADIEDGYKYKKLTLSEVEGALTEIAKAGGKRLNEQMSAAGRYGDDDKIAYLRAKAIDSLIAQCMKVFQQNIATIRDGNFGGSLLEKVPQYSQVDICRKLCEDKLFNADSVLQAELAGHTVVSGLLSIFVEALSEWESLGCQEGRLTNWHKKAYAIIAKACDLRNDTARYKWLLAATNYVAGMTDSFALRMYRSLKGITVPGMAG